MKKSGFSLREAAKLVISVTERTETGPLDESDVITNSTVLSLRDLPPRKLMLLTHGSGESERDEYVFPTDFLVFEYIEHRPLAEFYCLESIADVEARILSEAGIGNPFTTFQIPILFGQIAWYEIVERGERTVNWKVRPGVLPTRRKFR